MSINISYLFIFVCVNMDQGMQVDARSQAKVICFSFFHDMGTGDQI